MKFKCLVFTPWLLQRPDNCEEPTKFALKEMTELLPWRSPDLLA